jgi:hypothetical protein
MTNQSKIITIPHLGAETYVTGSCHLVQVQPEDGGGGIAILGYCFIQFSFPKPDWSAYRVTFSGDLGCTSTRTRQTPLFIIINNISFGKINNLLSQGRDMKYIAGHYNMQLALAWAGPRNDL